MQRPTTPSIKIDDTTAHLQPQSSPSRSNTRPRSTASSEAPEDAPWRRPSIRIRRQPSNPTVQRARAASIAAGARSRAGSTVEYRGVQHLTVPAGPGAAPPPLGTDGFLTVETLSRARSGSGGNQMLRHEERNLADVREGGGGRRRSSSDPPQMHWESLPGASGGQRDSGYMPPLEEDTATGPAPQRPPNAVLPQGNNLGDVDHNPDNGGYFGIGRRLSNAAGQTYSRFFPTLNMVNTEQMDPEEEQYEADMVNVLDTIGWCFQFYRCYCAMTDFIQIRKFRRSIPSPMSRTRCSCLIWENI